MFVSFFQIEKAKNSKKQNYGKVLL